MKLLELFDNSYEWEWIEGPPADETIAEFETDDGSRVEVIFYHYKDYYHLEFLRNRRQNLTGEGDQFKISSTILDIISDFIQKYKPNKLITIADKNEDRIKLYYRLLKNVANQFGYEISVNDEHTDYSITLTK